MKSHIAMKNVLLLSLLVTSSVYAKDLFAEGGELILRTSVWTKHYSPEPDHNNHQKLVGLEYYFRDETKFSMSSEEASWHDDVRWLVGAATFKNSYDQQTLYLYGGGRYDYVLDENTKAYINLTAGLLHGYRGEHRDKIPFNDFGIAPVVLPALGLQHRRLNIEVVPFAAAGVIINVGFYFR